MDEGAPFSFGFPNGGLALKAEDAAVRFSGKDTCLLYSWEETDVNRILSSLVGDLVDQSLPSAAQITLRVILGNPIREMRLDWETGDAPRTFSLPGFISLEAPANARLSLVLGAGETSLSHVTLAISLEADSLIQLKSSFSWMRGDNRELHRDAKGTRGKERPCFVLSLTARRAISLILMEFDLDQLTLPKLLREPLTPIHPLDLSSNETLYSPVSSSRPLRVNRASWDVAFTLDLEALQLPFLNKGSSQFLEIRQPDQSIAENKPEIDLERKIVRLPLILKVKIGDLEISTQFRTVFDWETFALSIDHGKGIELITKEPAIEGNFLGLKWTFAGKKLVTGPDAGKYHLFTLGTKNNNYQLLQAPGATIDLLYDGISNGSPLTFRTSDFAISPEGVGLTTVVLEEPTRLNGLNTKFVFSGSGIKIVRSKIEAFTIAGSGPLPPDLVGEATAQIKLEFKKDRNGNLILKGGYAALESNKLLQCRGTRFSFSIAKLALKFVHEGTFHLYFTLTGSAHFVLFPGDDQQGALAWLPNIKIDLIDCPLTGDMTVIGKHVDFLIELPKPVSFNFLGCFEMELRAIGFLPQADVFKGDGAMELTGQLKFAQGLGDSSDSRPDYHRLLIGLPQKGSLLPRLYFKSLVVNINMGEAFRLNGAVDYLDSESEKGFVGEGMVQIQGLPTMAASFGFLRVRESASRPWLRAWFIYLEARRLSLMIPVIQIYIREVGLGFGYRYTLVSIKAADKIKDTRKLLAELKKLSRTQGDLSKRDRWVVDLESKGQDPRWTIVLRAMISQTSAAPTPLSYNAAAESTLACLFLFDAVIALRSDLTFLMTVRGWINTNYHDYDSNIDNLRASPLFSGFVLLSPRQKRFLAHLASNPSGKVGPHPPLPDFVKSAIESAQFSATLLIEPGLLHYELGWPNMLRWGGKIGPLEVEVRGGFIFRVSRTELVLGSSVMARGSLKIEAGFSAGIVGVSISAYAEVAYGARYIGVISFDDFGGGSAVYAGIGLELFIEIAIAFWIKFAFFKKTFRFSVGIGFTASLELGIIGDGAPGLRGTGTIALKAMGRSLRFNIDIGLNASAVMEARERTENFLQIGLESSEVDRLPGIDPQPANGETAQSLRSFASFDTVSEAALSQSLEKKVVSGFAQLGQVAATSEIVAGFNAPHYSIFILKAVHNLSQVGETYYFVLFPQGERLNPETNEIVVEPGFYPVPPHQNLDTNTDFELTIPPWQGTDDAGFSLDRFDPKLNKWVNCPLSTASASTFSWQANWGQKILTGGERYGLEQLDVNGRPKEGEIPLAGNVSLTLREYMQDAFVKDNFDLATGVPIGDPLIPGQSKLIIDDRVQNPSENAFEAAVRGAVTQFRGSPFFKRDENYEYDRVLGKAFAAHTSIYASSAANLSNNESISQMQQTMQADQVRGAIIQDLIADIRSYAELTHPELIATSVPFQLGVVFRVTGNRIPEWLEKVVVGNAVPTIRQRLHPEASAVSDEIREVRTFNVHQTNFSSNPPRFERVKHYSDANTIAITWDLTWEQDSTYGYTPRQADPEHHLLHYVVRRRSLDRPEQDRIYSVSAVEVLHREADDDGNDVLKTLRPRFQIVDQFNKETLTEQAALPATGLSYYYAITPVDFAGNAGRPLTLVATRYPTDPPQVPTDGECTITYRLTEEETIPAGKTYDIPALVPPARIHVYWTESSSTNERSKPTTAQYRLVFRREQILPVGSYCLDSMTQGSRAKSLPSSFSMPRPFDILIDLDPTGPPGNRQAEIPLSSLTKAGVFPSENGLWRGESWQIFFQTVSMAGVPSALAPVGISLRFEAANIPEPDAAVLESEPEERRPAELEWLPVPTQLPVLPAEDQRVVVGMAHFPMPDKSTPLVFDLQNPFGDSVGVIRYQSHPKGVRCLRLRWNQGPSHLPNYPYTMNAGFHLLELDIDAHTTQTFANKELLGKALRTIQDVQLLPENDLTLAPADTLKTDQWEAWYPSSVKRLVSPEKRAEGSQIPMGPWYSWRESYLVWPQWPGLTDAKNGRRRSALHPYLEVLKSCLELGDQETGPPAFHVEIQTSPPFLPMDLTTFFVSTASKKDPYGWGILQRFGLTLAFTVRDADTGVILNGSELLQKVQHAIKRCQSTFNNGKDNAQWLEHLFVELLVQPGKSVYLEAQTALPTSSLLSMVQISLRPRVIQYLQYSLLKITGKPGEQVDIVFSNLKVPVSVLNLTEPEKGQINIDAETESYALPLVFPNNGRATIVMRSKTGFDLFAGSTSQVTKVEVRVPLKGALANHRPPAFRRFFEYSDSPIPSVKLLQPMSDIGSQVAELKDVFDSADYYIFDLLIEPLSSFEASNEFSTRFQIPDLSSAFSGAGAMSAQWLAFKRYAEALNGTESKNRIIVPTSKNEIESLLSGYLGWAQRFFDAGPPFAPKETEAAASSQATSPWIASAYPRASSPAYVSPDENGRLQYDRLISDKWAHTYRYYIRPYGRYDLLWRSLRQSYTLFPNHPLLPPDPSLPDLDAGGLDVVLDRIQPIEKPFILSSRRLDKGGSAKLPVPPGRIWEVIVAQHPEQALLERNQGLARRLAFRNVAFTLLRRFTYSSWQNTLHIADDNDWTITPVSSKYPEIPATLPALPDHLNLDQALDETSVLSIDIPDRIDDFQQGALILQWESLPFFYEYKLLLIAQTTTNVSEINAVVQQDFEYISPQVTAGIEGAVDHDGNRGRELIIPLQRLWDSLPPSAQLRWPEENPTLAPDDNRYRLPSSLPDPGVIYEIVTNSRGNLETQAELYVADVAPSQSGENPYAVRQLGKQFLFSVNGGLITPESPSDHYQLRILSKQRSEIVLSRPYPILPILGPKYFFEDSVLVVNGVMSLLEYEAIKRAISPSSKPPTSEITADLRAVDEFYTSLYQVEPVSRIIDLTEHLQIALDFIPLPTCTIFWEGGMNLEEQEALLALPGDNEFKESIVELLALVQSGSAAEAFHVSAVAGPEQLPAGIPSGITLEDFTWRGSENGGALSLQRNEQQSHFTSLNWHGVLTDNEKDLLLPGWQNWLQIADLRAALDSLLEQLENLEVTVKVIIRPEKFTEPLAGSLEIENNALIWHGSLITDEQRHALESLDGDADFLEAIHKLLTRIDATVTVTFGQIKDGDFVPPVLPPELSAQLSFNTDKSNYTVQWTGPAPDDNQQALLQDLATEENPDLLVQAVSQLIVALGKSQSIPLPPIRRPKSVPDTLQEQLVMGYDFLTWQGRIHDETQLLALVEFGRRNEKTAPEFGVAINALVQALGELTVTVPVSVEIRPSIDELAQSLRSKLLLGRIGLRLHGLMTRDEYNELTTLYSTTPDRQAILRLYNRALAYGLRNTTLNIRSRRGDAVPSPLHQIL